MMNDRIKDYFAFSAKEQRGLIALLGIMLLSFIINIIIPYLIPEKEFDIEPFRSEVEEFLSALNSSDTVPSLYKNKKAADQNSTTSQLDNFTTNPFFFNPSKLTEDEWIKMGMDTRIAKNITRYKEKGGFFRDKEGFRKIYGMNDEIFSVLEPYMVFDRPAAEHHTMAAGREKDTAKTANEIPVFETILIDLNSADSVALLTLNGIGPSYAGRIIKYRNRLGGFARNSQLLEIKGLDSIRLSLFKDQIIIDAHQIKKLDLNSVTFKELLKHPYFEYYLVKSIFEKKDAVKRFDSVGQIRDLPVMYEELYLKILPYLEVK